MKYALSILFFLFSFVAQAQLKLNGRVVDSETHKPLEGITIYLSHTTNGTTTNAKGDFQLEHVKPGKYELVATSLNYEDYVISVQVGSTNESISILLKPTSNQLKEVVVEPYDENGWDKWGDAFKSYFIGSDLLALNCVFTNPEVVKFKFGSNSNKLRAFTNEKLIFENNELGYRVIYLLSKFEIDFNNNTFSFKGYPLFEELKTNSPKQMAKWNLARNEAYKGSLRQFVRSLYFNQLAKDGFEVRSIKGVTKEEQNRVREVSKQRWANVNKDSVDYFTSVKNRGFDEHAVVVNKIIPRDSIISNAAEPNAKLFYFKDNLQVLFLNKKIPNEYAKTLPIYRANEFTRTEISLRLNNPITIYPNGNYYNGLDLLTDGYWAWSEKVATMLPSDFTPSKN